MVTASQTPPAYWLVGNAQDTPRNAERGHHVTCDVEGMILDRQDDEVEGG